jgi:hypothetical protein
MEWSDPDLHRNEDIQHLIALGTLKQGSAAYGIARQAIDLGFATLSNRQRYIYDQVIAPALKFAPSFESRYPAESCPIPMERERSAGDRH